MKIEGFDHLVLNVEDLDTTLRFYEETLGLEALRVEEFRRGEAPFPSVRISPDALIDLVQRPRATESNNVDHFCLIIEPTDMELLAAEMKSKGVEVSGEPGRRWGAHGYGLSFYIKDPEGNTIELKTHPPGYS